MKKILIGIAVIISVYGYGQKKTAYQIFTKTGKKITYEKMLKQLKTSDIILFGEEHNNPIDHWLEYEITNDLVKTNKLMLGSEMFETDNQQAVNKYLAGEIDKRGLDSMARLWPNFKDYAPLLDLAKINHLQFIASNIPRTYASLVYRQGFEALDSLPDNEKQWIAPLPIQYDENLSGYKNIMQAAHDHGGPNLPKAQAIKDATMAYFIAKNYKPEFTFVHYNGSYHSENFQGILWYLKLILPDLNYKTIASAPQADPTTLEEDNKGKADFIIVVDEDMATTY